MVHSRCRVFMRILLLDRLLATRQLSNERTDRPLDAPKDYETVITPAPTSWLATAEECLKSTDTNIYAKFEALLEASRRATYISAERPIAFKNEKGLNGENVCDPGLSENPYPTWQKLEEMVEKGKVKNIGLSNFNTRRIQNLTAIPLKVKPSVLQVAIELNFWNPQPELLKWTKENDLFVEAYTYSPLCGNKEVGETLCVPQVKKIADKPGITPAQVVISLHIQRGTVVLPNTVTSSRVVENLQVSALPDDLFAELESAAAAHEPKRVVNPGKECGLDFDIFND